MAVKSSGKTKINFKIRALLCLHDCRKYRFRQVYDQTTKQPSQFYL